MQVKCIVVDDEPPAIDELSFILNGMRHVTVIDTATSAGKAIAAIQEGKPDVVFLDIQMPGRDGFEVIKACGSRGTPPFFVFSTAYDQYAVKAFEANAIDYLLKPFQTARVQESIARAQQMLMDWRQGRLCDQVERFMAQFSEPPQEKTIISVEHKGRIRLLDPSDVVFFMAENREIKVHTKEQSFGLHGVLSLEALESKLQSRGFYRTHRSYLVNLDCIKEVAPWFNGRYILVAANQEGTEVPVSRSRVKALKMKLGL